MLGKKHNTKTGNRYFEIVAQFIYLGTTKKLKFYPRGK
jgi:hypothetical protein